MKLTLLLILASSVFGQAVESNSFVVRSAAEAFRSDAARRESSTGLVGVGVDGHAHDDCTVPIMTSGRWCKYHGAADKIDGSARQLALSQIAFVSSQALDLASCPPGCPEANPLLSTNGRMQGKGVAIKATFAVGMIVGQQLIVRKWPRAGKWLAWMNWGAAGATSGVVVGNFGIR